MKVLLISIDGLMPESYLNPDGGSYLPLLAKKGAFAESAIPVYPTLSMTNHATLATGVYADRHGLSSNTRFEPEDVPRWIGGESKDWWMDASSLKSPALWDLAREAGKSTALFRWPATRGAKADWLIPDAFSVAKGGPSTWQLTLQSSTPALMKEVLERRGPLQSEDDHAELDSWVSDAAAFVLANHSPDLVMLHMNSHDHEVHLHGRGSTEARQALWRSELHLKRLLSLVDFNETRVVILGDHGYLNFTRRVHLNALFHSRGWLDSRDGRITDWKVIAHTNCGQAGIYLRDSGDPDFSRTVLEALHEHAPGHYRILDREELRRLHSGTEMLCAIDALEGYSMGQRLEGPWVEETGELRGEHGYRPDLPQMRTGFLALGTGIPPGLRLPEIRLVDVAPTVARWLGLDLKRPDGVPIRFVA